MQATSPNKPVLATLLLCDLAYPNPPAHSEDQQLSLDSKDQILAQVRQLIDHFEGKEIDKTDGFLLLFERTFHAVAFALTLHDLLSKEKNQATGPQARVGLHLGEIYLHKNQAEDIARGAKAIEVEGLAKPLAARLMSAALPGQTLLSRAAFDIARRAAVGNNHPLLDGHLSQTNQWRWLSHGRYLLKGIEDPVDVFEVGIAGTAPLTPPPNTKKTRQVLGDGTIHGWRPAPNQEVPARSNWILDHKLGEGGFGEVWLATHRKSKDHQVFKFCFDGERLRGLKREVTLFRILKEALGNRRDIAKIIDWNFEEPPYFIESNYTKDGNLPEWANDQGGLDQVSLTTRINLVAEVADALAAAHSIGILHKDLKPSNILVDHDRTGGFHPKLNDFGIGLVDQDKLENSGITMSGFTKTLFDGSTDGAGTQVYLAPEILEGQPPTLKSDIYALGIMLYQMAIGDFNKPLATGWERAVQDPLLLEDIAICVDGDPSRRLDNAGELASRLKQLEARRQQRETETRLKAEAEHNMRELAKARRRRKLALMAMAIFAVFAITMGFQAHRIALEAERANQEAEAARAVSSFLVDVFQVADPGNNEGTSVTARELLDNAAGRIENSLADRPVIQARLRESMGTAYAQLGLYAQAADLLQAAYRQYLEGFGPNHLDTVRVMEQLGQVFVHQGEFEQATPLLTKALAVKLATFGSQNPQMIETYDHLSQLYAAQGRFDDAKPFSDHAARLRAAQTAGTKHASQQKSDAAAASPLRLTRQLKLPSDITQIWHSHPRNSLVVASSPNAIYLIDMEQSSPATPIPLEPGEQVLGMILDGRVLCGNEQGFFLRNLFPSKSSPRLQPVLEQKRPWLDAAIDEHGTLLAVAEHEQIILYDLAIPGAKRLFSWKLEDPPRFLCLEPPYLAWLETVKKGKAIAVSTQDGSRLLENGDWEGNAQALGIDPLRGTLAVAGWFNEVITFSLLQQPVPKTVHAIPGHKKGRIRFLLDGTMVLAGEGQIWFAPPKGEPYRYRDTDAVFSVPAFDAVGIMAFDLKANTLCHFDWVPWPLKSIKVSDQHIWAMTPHHREPIIFAGTADGQLHRYQLREDLLNSSQAHELGVTALIFSGQTLISGADDKTLAIWNAEDFSSVRQTKAHEWLVNDLWLDVKAATLWTGSSDGTIKSWSLPDLDPLQTLSISKNSVASLWMDENLGQGLVGMWGQFWLKLAKNGADWSITEKIPALVRGVYVIEPLEQKNLVALLSVDPARLWIYDIETMQHDEVILPQWIFSYCAAIDGRKLMIGGSNNLILFRFEREEKGWIAKGAATTHSEVGYTLALAHMAGSETLAIGSGQGQIHLAQLNQITWTPYPDQRIFSKPTPRH